MQDQKFLLSVFCEVKNNLDFYRGKVVRVRAAFHHDAGQVNLFDDACPNVALHAGLADVCQSCVGGRKALTIYSGFRTWYDSTARVVILGKLADWKTQPYLTTTMDSTSYAWSAEPIGSGRKDRIRYVGAYRFGANGNGGQITVTRKGDRLYESWGNDRPVEILPGKYDVFFTPGFPVLERFVRDTRGRVVGILYTMGSTEVEAKRVN